MLGGYYLPALVPLVFVFLQHLDTMIQQRIAVFIVLLAALATLFTSCNDLPTEAGNIYLPDTLRFAVLSSDTADIIKDIETDYRRAFVGNLQSEPLFNTGALFVGTTPQGMRAVSLLKMNFPVYLGSDTASYAITSAEIILRPRRNVIGDTSQNRLAFDVMELRQAWRTTFTYDTIAALEQLGALYKDQPVATYQGVISYTETTISSIRIPIDTALVRSWLKKAADSNAARELYGFALRPRSSGNSVIREFAHTAGEDLFRMEIGILYNDTTKPDSLRKIDTVLALGTQSTALIDAPLPQTPSLLAQGGVAIRSRLRFDVSSIPPLATIHRAELLLTANPDLSYYSTAGREDSVLLRLATNDSSLIGNVNSFTYCIRTSTSANVYRTSNLSFAVQYWMRRPEENYGLILQATPVNEVFRINRTLFYGLTEPDRSKRPSLIIYYSLPPRP